MSQLSFLHIRLHYIILKNISLYYHLSKAKKAEWIGNCYPTFPAHQKLHSGRPVGHPQLRKLPPRAVRHRRRSHPGWGCTTEQPLGVTYQPPGSPCMDWLPCRAARKCPYGIAALCWVTFWQQSGEGVLAG